MIDGHEFKSLQELIGWISPPKFRVFYIEGVRLSGKSFLAKKLSSSVCPYYTTYGSRKHQKHWFTSAGLDIGQGGLFVMDFLRQCPQPHVLIADRSTVSTVVFHRLHQEYGDQDWILPTEEMSNAAKLSLFITLLPMVNGCVLFVDPPAEMIEARAEKTDRTEELESIAAERLIYKEELAKLPEDRFFRFSPTEDIPDVIDIRHTVR